MALAIVGQAGLPMNAAHRLRDYTTIIAADGGADQCLALGIQPTAIIGDGDSSSHVVTPDPDQTTTDLQKALAYVQAYFPTETSIDLYGVISVDRFDHTLTALHCVQYDQRIDRVITPHQTIWRLHHTRVLHLPLNTLVSIVPITEQATIILQGLQWSGQFTLQTRYSGVSNTVTADPVSITVAAGQVILITS